MDTTANDDAKMTQTSDIIQLPRYDDDDNLIYPLCGGKGCISTNPRCKNTVLMMKHFPRSTWEVGNTAVVCCFVARVCNEHGLSTEVETKRFLKENPVL
jgi:hypothetical protein